MPDISMCPGGDCILKENCLRYTSKPNPHWQSYLTAPPYNPNKEPLPDMTSKKNSDAFWDYCSHFWPIKETWIAVYPTKSE